MENQPTTRSSRRKNAQPPRGTSKASSSRPTAPKPPIVPTPEIFILPPIPTVPIAPTTVAAPRAPTAAVVIPTTPAVVPTATSVESSKDAETEQLLKELMKKLNKKKKPSEFLAQVAADWEAEEALSQLNPLEIPPRPQMLVETQTSQALGALKENLQITPETLTQEIPPPTETSHTETQTSKEPLEEGEEENKMREDPDEEDAPSVGAGKGEKGSPSESEGGRGDVEGETAERRESEGGDMENVEEEIVEDRGVERVERSMSGEEEVDDSKDEGVEVHEKVGSVGTMNEGDGDERRVDESGERVEEVSEGQEEPEEVGEEEQDTDYLNAEEETETEVVDVDDLPSDDRERVTDERAARRHFRRGRKTEEAPPVTHLQELKLRDEDGSDDDVSQVQEFPTGTEDVSPEISEERYVAERKRKGNEEAKAHTKKPRRASTMAVIEEPTPETIRVPFAAAGGDESGPQEQEEETEDPPEEEGVYEKMEVLVTKKLLETMVEFSDPRQTTECGGRVGNGKVAKSGKSLCLRDLRDLGAEEKFMTYIRNIGFEWLLDHCDEEVPVPLGNEFFTSFLFKPTTDPDADSVTFRIFNQEMEMSIRRWSLRMGLFTLKEDEEGT